MGGAERGATRYKQNNRRHQIEFPGNRAPDKTKRGAKSKEEKDGKIGERRVSEAGGRAMGLGQSEEFLLEREEADVR